MTDRELAARWDADHRLAARTAFIAGAAAVAGTATFFSFGLAPIMAIQEGGTAGSFEITLVACLLLAVDLALLGFIVGLVHAFADAKSFALALATAVATLATTAAATIHLVWAYVAATPDVGLPAGIVAFTTWLAANLWLLPVYGLLVGATLLTLWLALRRSDFRYARRLAVASGVVGGLLLVVSPFTGFGPGGSALVAVAAILVATAGISALLAVALVGLGLLLWRKGSAAPAV